METSILSRSTSVESWFCETLQVLVRIRTAPARRATGQLWFHLQVRLHGNEALPEFRVKPKGLLAVWVKTNHRRRLQVKVHLDVFPELLLVHCWSHQNLPGFYWLVQNLVH